MSYIYHPKTHFGRPYHSVDMLCNVTPLRSLKGPDLAGKAQIRVRAEQSEVRDGRRCVRTSKTHIRCTGGMAGMWLCSSLRAVHASDWAIHGREVTPERNPIELGTTETCDLQREGGPPLGGRSPVSWVRLVRFGLLGSVMLVLGARCSCSGRFISGVWGRSRPALNVTKVVVGRSMWTMSSIGEE